MEGAGRMATCWPEEIRIALEPRHACNPAIRWIELPQFSMASWIFSIGSLAWVYTTASLHKINRFIKESFRYTIADTQRRAP